MKVQAPSIPALRIRAANHAAIRADGEFVLYWMIAARRLRYNFALERALDLATALGKPLVILEALRCDYPWASDRLHAFIADGMAANARYAARTGACYAAWIEDAPGAGRGLLKALGGRACAVVTDDTPAFFLPRMVARAAEILSVRLEAVDSNGLLPLRAAERAFPTAFAFRRFLQHELPRHIEDFPAPDPLIGALLPPLATWPEDIAGRWPMVGDDRAANRSAAWAALPVDHTELARLPIDHSVGVAPQRGGMDAASDRLRAFLDDQLPGYGERRNDPDDDCTSRLSPSLHFGHISSHEILAEIGRRVGWTPDVLRASGAGKRTGWWQMPPEVEGFLDQLVTWREIGFNFAATRDDSDRFDSLPPWARVTLAAHAADPRPHVYSLEEFASASTHDALWNAAQRQLAGEGRMHNYLRMLWGKKIIEWTRSPEEALAVMIELNNRLALDGRDPNSSTGIMWCLGRYDRPWGPERPIFGTVRFMSSANTARKLHVRNYLERWAG